VRRKGGKLYLDPRFSGGTEEEWAGLS
jgi:hypothetical protein